MSISSEITRITEAKADIVSALAEKGVSVASGASISDMGDYIRSIEAGVDMLEVYPVGAIYISRNVTSPAELFGGTWEQIKDRFLLGAGDTYSAWSTGGSATHTLTENEMPRHRHNFEGDGSKIIQDDASLIVSGSAYPNRAGISKGANYSSNGAVFIDYTGNSEAHNNMPPYRAVYIWQRTA